MHSIEQSSPKPQKIHFHRIFHLEFMLPEELPLLPVSSLAPQIFHIFIASSLGQIVKTIVPSGLKQLWPTAPTCAGTLIR